MKKTNMIPVSSMDNDLFSAMIANGFYERDITGGYEDEIYWFTKNKETIKVVAQHYISLYLQYYMKVEEER